MKITLMQAIIIFWSSLLVWVFIEYLFYRMQHTVHYTEQFAKHITKRAGKEMH